MYTVSTVRKTERETRLVPLFLPRPTALGKSNIQTTESEKDRVLQMLTPGIHFLRILSRPRPDKQPVVIIMRVEKTIPDDAKKDRDNLFLNRVYIRDDVNFSPSQGQQSKHIDVFSYMLCIASN